MTWRKKTALVITLKRNGRLLILQLQTTKLTPGVDHNKRQPDSLNQLVGDLCNSQKIRQSGTLIKILVGFQKQLRSLGSRACGQEPVKNQKIELLIKEDSWSSKLNLTENHSPGWATKFKMRPVQSALKKSILARKHELKIVATGFVSIVSRIGHWSQRIPVQIVSRNSIKSFPWMRWGRM